MIYEKYFQSIQELYNHDSSLPSHLLSNWGDKSTQEANFRKVTNLLKQTSYQSLLDVGSGIGSIQTFLEPNIEYTGIDITKSIVQIANSPKITEANILTFKPKRKYDAVICLGAFNMAVPFKDIKKALKRMEKLSNQITILTISYLSPDKKEKEKIQQMGYQIIQNNLGFSSGGDQYMFFKQHNINNLISIS